MKLSSKQSNRDSRAPGATDNCRSTQFPSLFILIVLLLIGGRSASARTLYSGVPENSTDRTVAAFSDLGSWHGFALPPNSRTDLAGGFIGPLLFDDGIWVSRQVLRFSPVIDGVPLDSDAIRSAVGHTRPGWLEQQIGIDGLDLEITLHFESATRAVMHATLRNPSEVAIAVQAQWTGFAFEGNRVEANPDHVSIRTTAGDRLFIAAPETKAGPVSNNEFRLQSTSSETLEAGQARTFIATISFGQVEQPDSIKASNEARDARWNRYLHRLDRGLDPNHPHQVLIEKCLMTLISNWRSPRGALTTDGLFPSSAVSYFNGFWAWDSWKHAVALARFDIELAKQQVRTMFEHQNDRGMVADVVYTDPKEDNWRDTKPPLSAWAVEEIFSRDSDLEFVRELYPKMTRYHQWWYRDRDHDGDGLCEYGSTDGTLIAARWESGMDNAVRFDHSKMLASSEGAWSMDQESVDLNAYLYREKRTLARLARALGLQEDAATFDQQAQALGARIRETMFDPATGWFYDTRIDGSDFIRRRGPEGWIPLWTGVASAEQAARVRQTLLDPQFFYTYVPFPTIARNDPDFSEGYWRGLVWIDQAWFAIEGLERYGYSEDAANATDRLIDHLEGATLPGVPLRENYNAISGEGRNVYHFSWTATHLLLLTLDHH